MSSSTCSWVVFCGWGGGHCETSRRWWWSRWWSRWLVAFDDSDCIGCGHSRWWSPRRLWSDCSGDCIGMPSHGHSRWWSPGRLWSDCSGCAHSRWCSLGRMWFFGRGHRWSWSGSRDVLLARSLHLDVLLDRDVASLRFGGFSLFLARFCLCWWLPTTLSVTEQDFSCQLLLPGRLPWLSPLLCPCLILLVAVGEFFILRVRVVNCGVACLFPFCSCNTFVPPGNEQCFVQRSMSRSKALVVEATVSCVCHLSFQEATGNQLSPCEPVIATNALQLPVEAVDDCPVAFH